jgi:hypothetical protein
MAEQQTFIRHGLPWTTEKMQDAAANLALNATLTFYFNLENVSVLAELNDSVFKQRPDLIFNVQKKPDANITDAEFAQLALMSHVKKLALRCANTTLDGLSGMQQLGHLVLTPYKKHNLNFIKPLKNLTILHINGKFDDLAAIGACTSLNRLLMCCPIDSFAFVKSLSNLSTIEIDSCTVTADFSDLNIASLKTLGLSQIKNLENVDFLAAFTQLEHLRLLASKLKTLPDLSLLKKLTKLNLNYLKVWQNPEILQSLSNLQLLRLEEINPKLSAAQLYFLADMPTLKTVDYRLSTLAKNALMR